MQEPEYLKLIPDEITQAMLDQLEALAIQLVSNQSLSIPDFNNWIWKFAPALVLGLLRKDKTKEQEIATKEQEIAAMKLTISRLAEMLYDAQRRIYPDIKPIDIEALLAESRKILAEAAFA